MMYDELTPDERERLHAAYEAGFAAAAYRPARIPKTLMLLIASVMDDWFRRFDVEKGIYDAQQIEPQPPDWLAAYAERVEALGDVTPPPGWHTAPLGNGGTR